MTTREELSIRLDPYWAERTYRGLDVGDGWLDLIDQLVTDLLNIGPMPELHQIKEKFGGLRFSVEEADNELYDFIEEIEVRSFGICEVCRAPGKVREGGWLKTLCRDHLYPRSMVPR